MAKRRTTTETAERAPRRSSREMLVAQLRKLPVDDLHDVLFDFGGLASRAAPLAVEAINEGMTAAKAGQFVPRSIEARVEFYDQPKTAPKDDDFEVRSA